MASSFLENLPTHFFRVPPVSERRPFDTVHILRVHLLVILPGTRVLRIALWPLVALLAFRATMGIDSHRWGPSENLIMFCFVVRTFEWTTAKDPLKRHLRPTGSSPSIFMDALDLSTNVRGIGWNWSKSLRVPPDARPSSRGWFIAYVLLSTWYHSSLEARSLMRHFLLFIRYFRSVIITVFAAVAIFAVMQLIYDIATLIGVIVLRQDPAQWPPVFDKPWKADSLRDFWGYRWHQLFRRTDGLLGSRSDAMGYVLGSFLASGVVHNIVVVMLNQNVEWWCMLLAFGMMAVGVLLEHMFTRMTGKEVGGWIGRVWSMAWLLVWGTGLLASTTLLDTACPVKGIVEYYVTVLDRWLRECAS
ncbi:hypothetical protein BKA82DRAFT_143647 [Pisolithus tinctorius]|nr:hypothetical protein BKA82DRAFT_143647 [Pisolithus tinctorius]